MVASCLVLVGISYIMLDILSGMIITPKTPVQEVTAEGSLLVPLKGTQVISMQASGDGRYLAYVERPAGGNRSVLHVAEPGSGGRIAFEKEINGVIIAWLGDTLHLAYEDGGDIQLLDVELGTVVNLTASPEYDNGPIPSPDGRYILWTVSAAAAAEGSPITGPTFWFMRADGSDKAVLAEAQDLPVWDSSGGRVLSRSKAVTTSREDEPRHYLQTAVPGVQGWEYYTECEGEALFVWWPSRDTVIYVGPLLVKEQDVVKGVFSRVEQPDMIKKVASTDGLGYETSYYSFFPSRRDALLAYVGEKGLEYLDYEERVIYRYPDLEARTPLAWNEVEKEIYYVGPEGIYGVAAGGE